MKKSLLLKNVLDKGDTSLQAELDAYLKVTGLEDYELTKEGITSQNEFVADLENAINEVKEQEQERVSYMTYAMKMLEERHEGMKEGKLKGEQRFGKLLSLLIKDNKTAEIAEIATNVRRRNQLFLEYGL